MRTMPSLDPYDQDYIKVKYVRYADDFVVMIIGNKELAEQTREEIRMFLWNELHLELNMEKTLVTRLSDRRIRFLGYEIAKSKEDTAITKDTLGRKKRTANGTIQLLVPADVIREKLKPFVAREKAVHHSARINLSALDLLTQYNAEIRGLYEYYSLATDVSTKIGKFKYYHYYSLLKTVARKEKCSIAKVLDKYGVNVKLKQATGTRKIFGVHYETKDGTHIMTTSTTQSRRKINPTRAKPQTESLMWLSPKGIKFLIGSTLASANSANTSQQTLKISRSITSENSRTSSKSIPNGATVSRIGCWQ
jgi:hypothetical protein